MREDDHQFKANSMKIRLQLVFFHFNLVLSIMSQPVFSVSLFIYRTLNCHSHSTNTKPKNMLMFLLCIERIFID